MITRIWWDLDETLSSTLLFRDGDEPFQFDFAFKLDPDIYHVKVNPSSYKLLEFSRNLIGPENVWMLTSATRDYALTINSHAPFGFPPNQIVAREELRKIVEEQKWNPDYKNPYKDQHSVLIDNLSPRYNEEKLICLGIKLDTLDRYCKVDDYYGMPIEGFEEEVVEYLNRKYNE